MKNDAKNPVEPGPAAADPKPRYETPVIIPLGDLAVGFGAKCESGSAPTQGGKCEAGGSAAGNKCESGGAAGNKCATGGSTGGKCEAGSIAVNKCASGGNR